MNTKDNSSEKHVKILTRLKALSARTAKHEGKAHVVKAIEAYEKMFVTPKNRGERDGLHGARHQGLRVDITSFKPDPKHLLKKATLRSFVITRGNKEEIGKKYFPAENIALF